VHFLSAKRDNDNAHHITKEGINMQHAKSESIFSAVRKIFAGETPEKQAATEMRPLTDDELRAVAGGPECEVGGGG